nr:stage VI sporulation protein F [Salsuginibacillus kocurii]
MDHRQDGSFFDQVQKQTNVGQQDLMQLAQLVEQADLKDETSVRQLIRQVAQTANVQVSREKEEQLVKAIVNDEVPMDFATLGQLFGNQG